MTDYKPAIPVKVRIARAEHCCNDCEQPIEPGDRYEYSVTPPHRISEYDVDRWLIWRCHYPRWDGSVFLAGCAEAAAYREKRERELANG